MKGRSDFTAAQAEEIRRVLAMAQAASGMVTQEFLDRLRTEFRFVAADWSRAPLGPDDFDALVEKGKIRIRSAAPPARPRGRSRDPVSPMLALAPVKARPIDDKTPKEPGFYAVYAAPDAWAALGLGPPPDPRPLYVGKGENLARELANDFAEPRASGPSPTGHSDLRRSLAALLGYSGAPRNQANPGDFTEYGLVHEDDVRLTAWMRKHLKVAVCPAEVTAPVEAALVAGLTPALKAAVWADTLKKARSRMTSEARAWADR